MTIDMTSCEQCALGMPTAEAMYSTSGQQVCRACHAKSEEMAAADRVTARLRTVRSASLGAALLVLGFAGAMFAMGDGALVGAAIALLGGIATIAGRLFMRSPKTKTGNITLSYGWASLLFWGGLAVLSLGAVIMASAPRAYR